jgi:hypothetical protein
MGTVTKPVIVQLHTGGSARKPYPLEMLLCTCMVLYRPIILRSRVLANFFICFTSTSTLDLRVQLHSMQYAIQLFRNCSRAHDYLRSAGDGL